MVAKISSTANIGGALGYNFKKVSAGDAKILLVSGLSLDSDGTTSMERALTDMTLLLPSAMRTKKPVFHVSLNPHPDDMLSDADLEAIAAYYMERLGYGNQPYIVFKHNDIEREHIHIVSLRVDSDGHKINDSFERRRSKRITDEIERLWKLKTSNRRLQTPAEESVTTESDEREVKKQIAGSVSTILNKYRFQSLGELNAVLASFSIVAEDVAKERNGRRYKGIVYFITDENGKKRTVPVDAGELGRGFGYNALKNRMDGFKSEFAPYRDNLRKAVRNAMRENPDRERFVSLMERQGISVELSENHTGRIYSITFIERSNGVVANGSRLGRGYSAGVFNGYFNGSGDNPFLNIGVQCDSCQKQMTVTESRSDDILAGITDELLDMPSGQGVDYKEMAFQKKMRRLHSGKLKRKK